MTLELDLSFLSPEALVGLLETEFPQKVDPLRDKLGLLDEYITWVRGGRKQTTIRYRHGQIDCPKSFYLPVYVTTWADFNSNGESCVGWAHLTKMVIKTFNQLSYEDAVRDGFLSLSELKNALQHIYGRINENELVTIYTFEFEESSESSSQPRQTR